MTLGSGAHIQLGTLTSGEAAEYMLDENVEPHYNKRYERALTGQQMIGGEAQKYQSNPGRLYWSQTDWQGGEGIEQYDVRDPTPYNYSTGANVRRKGQMTGRPDRNDMSTGIAETTVTGKRPGYFASGGGVDWFAAEENCAFSTDYGAAWTKVTSFPTAVTNDDLVTALCGDARGVYASVTNTAGTVRHVLHIPGTAAAAGSTTTTVVTRATGTFAFIGLCITNGRLYGWDGRKLWQISLDSGDWPATPAMVYDGKIQLDFATGTTRQHKVHGTGGWYGDVKESENSAVFFTASDGRTDVFEYKGGAGAPIFRLPLGFTGRSMCIQNGICFVAGQFGARAAGSEGAGGLYAMDLATRKIFFINHFRKLQGSMLTMAEMGNSWGGQVLISDAKGGKVFVYDMETDGISLLDDLSNTTDNGTNLQVATWGANNIITALHTTGPYRLAAISRDDAAATENWNVVRWANDEPTNREASGTVVHTLDSSQWDLDYPLDAKQLIGFRVHFRVEDTTTSGLILKQRILIKYALDGDPNSPSYTSAGTIESTSTPLNSTKGMVFVPVATSSVDKKFYRIQVQITVDNKGGDASGGVKLPIVYSVVGECELGANTETWDLVLKTEDEPQGGIAASRPSKRQYSGTQLINALKTSMANKAAVTFKDGYLSQTPGVFTTHTVTIEEMEIAATNTGEGAVRVKLKSVLAEN